VACTDRNNEEKVNLLNIINIILKDNSKTAQVLVIQNMNKQVTTLLPKPLMMLKISNKKGQLDLNTVLPTK
jgi:hypothetical protein